MRRGRRAGIRYNAHGARPIVLGPHRATGSFSNIQTSGTWACAELCALGPLAMSPTAAVFLLAAAPILTIRAVCRLEL